MDDPALAPEQLQDMFAAAGLEPIVELRIPQVAPMPRPQVLLIGKRP